MEAALRPTPKVRILVADDEPDLLSIIQESLQREGFIVETAANGKIALDAIKANPPDIAILDWRMPVMDGFEVCKQLRTDPVFEHLPVVLLSATATRDSKVEGLSLGADDFLTKPIDLLELMARIRMILKRSRQGLEANPLTRLPGNVSIETRIDDMLAGEKPLAVLYLDLNQFKAFNDAYGYDAGDHVIKATGQLLLKLTRAASDGTFVGHIGGDDFIIIAHPSEMESLARDVISEFDKIAPTFYNEKDRGRGKIVAHDRKGSLVEFPLLSIAIGICHNLYHSLESYAHIAELGAELKKHAKERSGSAYIIDRRRD